MFWFRARAIVPCLLHVSDHLTALTRLYELALGTHLARRLHPFTHPCTHPCTLAPARSRRIRRTDSTRVGTTYRQRATSRVRRLAGGVEDDGASPVKHLKPPYKWC